PARGCAWVSVPGRAGVTARVLRGVSLAARNWVGTAALAPVAAALRLVAAVLARVSAPLSLVGAAAGTLVTALLWVTALARVTVPAGVLVAVTGALVAAALPRVGAVCRAVPGRPSAVPGGGCGVIAALAVPSRRVR